MSKLTSLDDLFVHELQEVYGAEGQILAALPDMTKAATNPDLKNAFEEHRQQTEHHTRRLERVFMLLGVPARAKTCDGVAALLNEGRKIMSKVGESEVLDAALISAAQKLEHYEIASYGCLCTYAEMLGYDQAHTLLGQTLDEEETCDMRLTEVAEAVINPHAVEGVAHDQAKYRRAGDRSSRGGERAQWTAGDSQGWGERVSERRRWRE